MITIAVFHPQHPEINDGLTRFTGEEDMEMRVDDGVLIIQQWRTPTESGSAVFAKGSWAYAWTSKLLPIDSDDVVGTTAEEEQKE